MISELVQKRAVWFHGVPHYPINICMRCGEEDDPESAQQWERDDDDDKMCPRCAALNPSHLQEGKET